MKDFNKENCSVCETEILAPPIFIRKNIHSGKKQYFCEKCWIEHVPLSRIFSLSKEHRKMKLADMDEGELEAYANLRNRYYSAKILKWIFPLFAVGIIILIRSCF